MVSEPLSEKHCEHRPQRARCGLLGGAARPLPIHSVTPQGTVHVVLQLIHTDWHWLKATFQGGSSLSGLGPPLRIHLSSTGLGRGQTFLNKLRCLTRNPNQQGSNQTSLQHLETVTHACKAYVWVVVGVEKAPPRKGPEK